MKLDSIKDSTRCIVGELHQGSVLPGNRSEMWRSVFLENGADIKGGVFGDNLTVHGPGVSVLESSYLRGEIRIINDTSQPKGEVVFNSVVISQDSLYIEESEHVTRFCSDIYVNTVRLTNAIVYGNIYATNAFISNSIVLGGIYCRKILQIENSLVYTFDVNELIIKENVCLLSPFGIATQPFEIPFPVKALTFHNMIDDSRQAKGTGAISLDEQDVFELRSTMGTEGPLINKYLLSIVERVLNSTEIIEAFRKNKMVIEYLSLGSHLDREYSSQFAEFTRDTVEKSLWAVLRGEGHARKKTSRTPLKEIIERLYKS